MKLSWSYFDREIWVVKSNVVLEAVRGQLWISYAHTHVHTHLQDVMMRFKSQLLWTQPREIDAEDQTEMKTEPYKFHMFVEMCLLEPYRPMNYTENTNQIHTRTSRNINIDISTFHMHLITLHNNSFPLLLVYTYIRCAAVHIFRSVSLYFRAIYSILMFSRFGK